MLSSDVPCSVGLESLEWVRPRSYRAYIGGYVGEMRVRIDVYKPSHG